VDWSRPRANRPGPRRLLSGSSPASTGDEPERRQLAAAIHADPGSAALLDPNSDSDADASDRLNALCSRDGAVGDAARAWLRLVGYRSVYGWEPMESYALEVPDDLLSSVRSALNPQNPTLDESVLASIRDQIPEAHRDEFDSLLSEARAVSRIRDERDIYCNLPIAGILRRAVIEAGRRVHQQGRIHEIEHMTEAGPSEVAPLLEGSASSDPGSPSANELADRYLYRTTHSVADIPAQLGQPDRLPVPPDWLPDAANLVNSAVTIQTQVNRAVAPESTQPDVLQGIIASSGHFEGPARIVGGPEDFDKIQVGDILITGATNPAFSILLPKLGAIVTDHGGALSHAAIIAREFGLPAVVGTSKATQTFHDGQRLRVNADDGTVTLLP